MAFDIVTYSVMQRFQKNQNALSIFVGQTGCGKTYASIKSYENACRRLRIKPTIDHIVIGDAKEFLELVSSGLRSRTLVIFDEIGVGLPAREFQSVANKVLGYVLETFRRDQIGVHFSTPDIGFLDIKARKLMHYYCEMIDPNQYGTPFGHAKFMNIRFSPRGEGVVYYRYPIVTIDGRTFACKPNDYKSGNIEFGLPTNSKLLEQYEVKKKSFVDNLKDQAIHQMRQMNRRIVSSRRIADMVLQDPETFGMGYLRLYDGIPSQKSVNYVKTYFKSQFEVNDVYSQHNFLLTKDVLEQSILLVNAEMNPTHLEILQHRTRGLTDTQIAQRMNKSRAYVSRLAGTRRTNQDIQEVNDGDEPSGGNQDAEDDGIDHGENDFESI